MKFKCLVGFQILILLIDYIGSNNYSTIYLLIIFILMNLNVLRKYYTDDFKKLRFQLLADKKYEDLKEEEILKGQKLVTTHEIYITNIGIVAFLIIYLVEKNIL